MKVFVNLEISLTSKNYQMKDPPVDYTMVVMKLAYASMKGNMPVRNLIYVKIWDRRPHFRNWSKSFVLDFVSRKRAR